MPVSVRLLIVFFLLSGCAGERPREGPTTAPEPVTLALWPGTGAVPADETLPDRGDDITRVTHVANPSLTVYRPAGATAPSAAVLVFPGGGYEILAIDLEGAEIAQWLNTLGITAVLVRYTVPDDREAAFRDAQRALALTRAHAAEWGVDPARVGVIGFSAGGHLAARLSNGFRVRSYEAVDEADRLGLRPDFAMLVYPAYLVDDGRLNDEVAVSAATPPTVLVQTQDDAIGVENSLYYYLGLERAGVPSELHIFPAGGHGYGLRPSTDAVSGWPALCRTWLAHNGIIAR